MSGEDDKARTVADFRELLKEQYELPEEARSGKRKERRRARQEHKRTRKETTRRVLEEERRREPMTPAGAAVIIAAILAIGWGATHWLGSDKESGAGVAVAASPTPAAPSASATSASPSASEASPSASTPVVDLSTPEKTADGWGRVYLTRNPPVDRDHKPSVERAAPWMTRALAANLTANEDRLWNELVSNGGISTVLSVDVGKATQGLPVDTPLRVWRQAKVTAHIDGYKQYEQTYVFQVEMTHSSKGWRVARVLGV
ncbi:hypothetical protein [Streptomyces sp. NRRL S-87]|uniref:hypothetical protein n=1 Tax=Streptomyces sp. NRRL S-87 TaxID=1463920 RepID=UPI0004C07A29|nr:hypothetical protein [Streptomyces sp. NRRL S-87]